MDVAWQSTDAETRGFILERTTTGDYTQLSGITQPTATQYTDHSVFPDNSYLYRVRTIDAAGNLSTPTTLANAVLVPDACGASVPRTKVTPRNPAAPVVPSTSTAPAAPSVPTVTSPKPADEITIPDSGSGVVSPQAPAVPKPADELDIPATRPKS